MDWELYERYRATVLFVGVAFVSLLLLAFQRSSPVRHLRTFLVTLTMPTERFLSRVKSSETPSGVMPGENGQPSEQRAPAWSWAPESERLMRVLKQENQRMRDLLALRETVAGAPIAAHVAGRDPHRWFQELILDKGKKDGADVDDPVIAVVAGRESLVGRVIEVSDHVAKVMLIQDSLSAVAATVQSASPEEGVVEGSNSHDLYLKYLDRSCPLKIGDAVVTSGLGNTFPEGIPLGWVEEIGLDSRQLFLQARLRPAMQGTPLHEVLVLRHE